MSYNSKKSPNKPNVLIVGERWSASVLAYQLMSQGVAPKLFFLEGSDDLEKVDLPVHIGNGETYERARLAMGDALARKLWDISSESYKKLKALMTRLNIPLTEGKTLWFAGDESSRKLLEATVRHNPVAESLKGPEWLRQGTRKFEAVVSEPALQFSPAKLSKTLGVKFVEQEIRAEKISSLDKIESHQGMEYRVHYHGGGKAQHIDVSLVALVSDRLSPELFPSMHEKWIPVTLSSFSFKAKTHKEFAVALFNGGADFAVRSGGQLRLGSYRNLYADKALGVRKDLDKATLDGVTDFFGALDWVYPEGPLGSYLTVESISCDGLPIVGPVGEFPGVHVLAGFGGRPQHYLFEVAEQWARSVAKSEPAAKLEFMSTKRWV